MNKDEIFNYGIRAIMLAPRGQPSPMQAALIRAYNQHEMAKCFDDEDKKILPLTRATALKYNSVNSFPNEEYQPLNSFEHTYYISS